MHVSHMGKKLAVLLASAAIACMGCGLVACGGGQDAGKAQDAQEESVELQIFAANSLEQAMPVVQEMYTAKHPNVTFAASQFKGSGELVEQIEAGAQTDILITASKSTMDDAEDKIVPESRIVMFNNDLVVCAAEDSDISIEGLEDLDDKKIKKIAIGDPALVPAGKYANQSLYSVGIGKALYTNAEGEGGAYDKSIADKVALSNSVGTCAQWVATGNCDVGFVYVSDLYRYDGIKNIYTVPEEMHKPITYPGAVLASSANQEAAKDFLEFCMTDADALQVWLQYGFQLR